jgi:hypothetical protein
VRLLLTISALLLSRYVYSQTDNVDHLVRALEKQRNEKRLTGRVYPGKIFVGSLTGYYDAQDSLVMINTLTDAEEAGTETLYYFQHGLLKRVYVMAARLDSNPEWTEYFSKHTSTDNCKSCHSKPNCTVTIITLAADTTLEMTENLRARKIAQSERTKVISEIVATSKELRVMLKELK